MGVYIKGLQMPDCCWDCHCMGGEFVDFCNPLMKETRSDKVRHEDCPLIELPDHGDLIDMDKLTVNDSLVWIKYLCPVVILAERSEE